VQLEIFILQYIIIIIITTGIMVYLLAMNVALKGRQHVWNLSDGMSKFRNIFTFKIYDPPKNVSHTSCNYDLPLYHSSQRISTAIDNFFVKSKEK